MKIIKHLLIAMVLLLNVMAVEATTLSKQFQMVEDYNVEPYVYKDLFKLTISSDNLQSNWVLNGNPSGGYMTHVRGDYRIYSNKYYVFYITNESSVPVTPEGPAEIEISHEGLTEGSVYDVYYYEWDNVNHEYKIDTDHLNDTARVVKEDDKLVIRFTASVIKPFLLDMHMSDAYKSELDKLLTSGYYAFPGVKLNVPAMGRFDFYTYFDCFRKQSRDITIWPVDVDEEEITDEYRYMTLEFKSVPNETHIVKYKMNDSDVAKILQAKISEIESELEKYVIPDVNDPSQERVFFEVEDLNYINYLKNSKSTSHTDAINYSTDLKRMLKNTNYKYYFDFRAGDDTPFGNLAFGFMNLSYDGLIIPLVNTEAGYLIKQVVYVPDDTQNTSASLLNAAKKRIKEYLGTDDFTLEIGGTRAAFAEANEYTEEAWESYYNEEAMSDDYYVLTINNRTVNLVIERNSEEIANMEYKIKDLLTDVEISTKSGSLPYDSLISVDKLSEDSSEYKELLKKLNKEYGDIFDINLFSESADKYITKLENGTFEVKIPLKEEFKGKDLSAFYLKTDGTYEEYPITPKGNYGVFYTNHFSTYTIAPISQSNPQTGDKIIGLVSVGAVALLGMIGVVIYIKKKKAN